MSSVLRLSRDDASPVCKSSCIVQVDEPLTAQLCKNSSMEFELADQWPRERIKLDYLVKFEASARRHVESDSDKNSSSSSEDRRIVADRLSVMFSFKFYNHVHEVFNELDQHHLYRVSVRALLKDDREDDRQLHASFPVGELTARRQADSIDFGGQEMLLPANDAAWRVLHLCFRVEREIENVAPCLRNDRPDLLNNPFCSDVMLLYESERIHAHKIILASKSAYFRRLFELQQLHNDEDTGVIQLDTENGIGLETTCQLLKFIYADEVNWQVVDAELLYLAAAKYEVAELKRHCIEQMIHELSPETAPRLYMLARAWQLAVLLRTLRSFFINYESRMVQVAEYRSLLCETLSRDNVLHALKLVAKYPELMESETDEVFGYVADNYEQLRDRLTGPFFASFPDVAHDLFKYILDWRFSREVLSPVMQDD